MVTRGRSKQLGRFPRYLLVLSWLVLVHTVVTSWRLDSNSSSKFQVIQSIHKGAKVDRKKANKHLVVCLETNVTPSKPSLGWLYDCDVMQILKLRLCHHVAVNILISWTVEPEGVELEASQYTSNKSSGENGALFSGH